MFPNTLATAAMGRTFQNDQLNRRAAFISWRWLAIAFFLIIVVAFGILIAIKARGSEIDRGEGALIDAFSKRRLIEPRLSGGFTCGDFRPSREDMSGIKTEKFEQARNLITDAAAKGDSSADLPYARMLLSKDEKLPEALKYLRRAVARAPESAEAHNDLGVCFIQQGKLEDAIDEFEVALSRGPDMPEALFNRALCYRRLRLRDAAETDLSRLLEVERDPGWLAEAGRRRDELSRSAASRPSDDMIPNLNKALTDDLKQAREIVDRNYAAIRKYFFFELAPQYLQSAEAPGPSSGDLIGSRMATIAQLAVEVKSDHDIADTVTRLIAIPEQERAEELRLLREYEEAASLISRRKYDEAQVAMVRLGKVFQEKGDSLFQAKTKYAVAQSLYQSRRFTASRELLEEILPIFEARGWRYHQAWTLNLLGLDSSRLGQDSKAMGYFRQNYELFRSMHESVASPLQLVGLTYWHLGDFEKALDRFRASTDLFLEEGSHFGDLAYNYLNVADVYRLLDKGRLALLFAEEALKYSNKAEDMNRAAQTLSFEAVEYAHAGEFDIAAERIKRAFEHLQRLGPADRAYTEPLVLVRAGEVAVRCGDIVSGCQHYTKAESLASQAEGDPILHINALRGRADAYLRAGQRGEARRDLDKAIKIIERYRENLIERLHRMEFLAASQSVFDQMILLDVDQPGRASEAFEMSERSRARGLLDDFVPPGSPETQTSRPISLARAKAALPDKLALLVFSVTSESTHVFLITRGDFRIARSPATTNELDLLVNDYVSQVRTNAPIDELSTRARVLYDLLIGPVRQWLASDTVLCIVPDKSLQLLPMAALKDSSDRYLIESFPLVLAPSVSIFIRCVTEARANKVRTEEQLLAVGDPAFDEKLFPKLRGLSDARDEASGASVFYDRPVVLTDAKATEPDVRAAMKKCNVAHLALHCVVNPQSPWLSALVLAPEKGQPESRLDNSTKRESNSLAMRASEDAFGIPQAPVDDSGDGLLYMSEIYNLKLPATRMVVLSACETALGQYYRGEGIVSLIHPFLAARVSTVVASLWPVESHATSVLMIGFHKERRKAGKRAGNALRDAQLKMIADFPHPYYWASFIVVGGNY